MNSAYSRVLKQKTEICANWTARIFASSSTYRIFRRGQKPKIQYFLMKYISDGKSLANLKPEEYDQRVKKLVAKFQAKFRCNRNMNYRRPNFGQAAKPINLYVKTLLHLPEYLLGYSKKRIEKNAHVVLDSVILNHLWADFEHELKNKDIRKAPKLSTLEKKAYFTIQSILREAAHRKNLPSVAYDYLWAIREEKP